MAASVSLEVNHQSIDMIPFVEDYVAGVAEGIVQSLRGAAPTKELEIAVEGETVSVKQNGSGLEVNEFVSKIIRSTVFGMVSALKGAENPQTVTIKVQN